MGSLEPLHYLKEARWWAVKAWRRSLPAAIGQSLINLVPVNWAGVKFLDFDVNRFTTRRAPSCSSSGKRMTLADEIIAVKRLVLLISPVVTALLAAIKFFEIYGRSLSRTGAELSKDSCIFRHHGSGSGPSRRRAEIVRIIGIWRCGGAASFPAQPL